MNNCVQGRKRGKKWIQTTPINTNNPPENNQVDESGSDPSTKRGDARKIRCIRCKLSFGELDDTNTPVNAGTMLVPSGECMDPIKSIVKDTSEQKAIVTPEVCNLPVFKHTTKSVCHRSVRRSIVRRSQPSVNCIHKPQKKPMSASLVEDKEEGKDISVSSFPENIPDPNCKWNQIKLNARIHIAPSVRRIYNIINRKTGSIGGNGAGGPIYGELTMGSMQKVINLMKQYTDLSRQSKFIDVGCGLGKPNLHVAQDPGVEFSYGIEMEKVRWLLGMHNLNHVLKDERSAVVRKNEEMLGFSHHIFLAYGNIKDATTFDPFTHVYMFDIGFPPSLFHILSKMFNKSFSEYLICFHTPKLIIGEYDFKVEFLVQCPTYMHGSNESHMVYIYRRNHALDGPPNVAVKERTCDEFYADAWKYAQMDIDSVSKYVQCTIDEEINGETCISQRTRRGAKNNL